MRRLRRGEPPARKLTSGSSKSGAEDSSAPLPAVAKPKTNKLIKQRLQDILLEIVVLDGRSVSRIDLILREVCTAAAEGAAWAVEFIANYTDGKPAPTSVEIEHNNEVFAFTLNLSNNNNPHKTLADARASGSAPIIDNSADDFSDYAPRKATNGNGHTPYRDFVSEYNATLEEDDSALDEQGHRRMWDGK